MTKPAPSTPSAPTPRVVARGAWVNGLGALGKLLVPVSFIVVTRLFGPDVTGQFVLAVILVDVATNFTVSGINDGVLMLASRENAAEGDRGLYHVLANGFALSLGIAMVLVAGSWVGGPAAIRWAYEDADALVPAVQIMVWAVPFRATSLVVLAAVKAKLTMKWDAVLTGFGRAAAFLVAAVLAYGLDPGLNALAWAYLAGWAVVGVAAGLVFPRYYRYRALGSALARLRLCGELVRFAIPQNLNMAFGRFATDIDALMLAYFNVPAAQIGFYWMGGQVVRNVRQIKLIFSGVYAPVIARLHAAGDPESMNRSFSMVSRWTTTLAIPVALVVVIFRSELLVLFHDTYTDDTRFMLFLLTIPLLSCCFGLASNVIVMTGHAQWNLFNAVAAAAVNLALNAAWIPRFGILGAAAASMVSSLLTTAMTLLEARLLVGVSLDPRQVFRPYLAGAAAGCATLVWLGAAAPQAVAAKALGCLVTLGVYGSVLVLLRIPSEDLDALMPWRR